MYELLTTRFQGVDKPEIELATCKAEYGISAGERPMMSMPMVSRWIVGAGGGIGRGHWRWGLRTPGFAAKFPVRDTKPR